MNNGKEGSGTGVIEQIKNGTRMLILTNFVADRKSVFFDYMPAALFTVTSVSENGAILQDCKGQELTLRWDDPGINSLDDAQPMVTVLYESARDTYLLAKKREKFLEKLGTKVKTSNPTEH